MRGMEKRGQSGATLVEVLIALAVVVALLYAIYYAYSQYTAAAQYVPGDLSKLAFACDGYSRVSDKADYCVEPREISFGRETRYVNCEYPGVKSFITDKTLAGQCPGNSFTTMCTTLQGRLGNNYVASKVFVNDVACSGTAAGSVTAEQAKKFGTDCQNVNGMMQITCAKGEVSGITPIAGWKCCVK
jgi:hypothetical protein